jgi:hypothetical protein
MIRPEYEPDVPLDPAELTAFIVRLHKYVETSQLDQGLCQMLRRSAAWLERARPLLERQGRPWWRRGPR